MIKVGSRVKVFDPRLFKNDYETPRSHTVRLGTVTCRYGFESQWGRYPDVIDVVFDHRPESVSKAHFTELVEEIA